MTRQVCWRQIYIKQAFYIYFSGIHEQRTAAERGLPSIVKLHEGNIHELFVQVAYFTININHILKICNEYFHQLQPSNKYMGDVEILHMRNRNKISYASFVSSFYFDTYSIAKKNIQHVHYKITELYLISFCIKMC